MNSWNLLQPTRPDASVLPPPPENRVPEDSPNHPDSILLCRPCGTSANPPPNITRAVNASNVPTNKDTGSEYVLVSINSLRKSVEENICCKACIEKYYHERELKFHKYCDTYRQEQFDEVMRSNRT